MIQFMQTLEVEDNDENFPKTPVLQKSIVQCITDSPPYIEMTCKKALEIIVAMREAKEPKRGVKRREETYEDGIENKRMKHDNDVGPPVKINSAPRRDEDEVERSIKCETKPHYGLD